MSANVRCAGGGDMSVIRVTGTTAHLTLNGEPCGWEGARSRRSYSAPGTRHVNLTKPCPRCGGRVELIPEES